MCFHADENERKHGRMCMATQDQSICQSDCDALPLLQQRAYKDLFLLYVTKVEHYVIKEELSMLYHRLV